MPVGCPFSWATATRARSGAPRLAAVKQGSPLLEDVALVHGEADAQDAFAATLRSLGYRVRVAVPGDRMPVR